ncbi:hypothetical protein MMC17_000170 [Xylographa soralifera]|nr:hypothetical protein [Xylographa soralifera]
MEMIEQPGPHRNQTCPPEKGFALISISAFLPWYLGAGNYSVRFDAKTKEGKRIYCLEADFYLGCREGTDSECRDLA